MDGWMDDVEGSLEGMESRRCVSVVPNRERAPDLSFNFFLLSSDDHSPREEEGQDGQHSSLASSGEESRQMIITIWG